MPDLHGKIETTSFLFLLILLKTYPFAVIYKSIPISEL